MWIILSVYLESVYFVVVSNIHVIWLFPWIWQSFLTLYLRYLVQG